MRKSRKSMILLVVFLNPFVIWAADKPSAVTTNLELINQEYAAGKLDYSAYLLLKLQAARHNQALPGRYQAEGVLPLRCGTLPGMEAIRVWNQLDQPTQSSLLSYLQRPSLPFTYDSPGGNFKIHYATAGADAVPGADTNSNSVPDYVERLAEYADSSWHTEVDILGYYLPPSDGGVGGDNKYDIYALDLGTGLYGYCQPENPGPQPWNDYDSYIAVHKDMVTGFSCPNGDPDGVQLGRLKVTVAHEFFHAVQFAYDVFDSDWFYETSSTWMEDVVFDQTNDYYCYLPGHFVYPEISLQEVNGFSEYAHCIWNHFLAENFGDSLIREVWEGMISSSAIPVMQSILSGKYGTSFSEEFQEFTVWNYITGFRDDGAHYSEAASYDTAWIMREENSFPFYSHGPSTSPYDERPDNLSCNYIRLNVQSLSGKLLVFFDGQDGMPWGAGVVKQVSVGTYDFDQITLNGSGAGELEIPVVENYEEVVLIPTLLATSGLNRTYSYSAYQCLAIPGDADASGTLSLTDAIAAVNYIFNRAGCTPLPLCWLSGLACRGDWNGDSQVTLTDVIRAVNHIFNKPGGPWTPLPVGACCLPLP